MSLMLFVPIEDPWSFSCEPYPLSLRSAFGTAHSSSTSRTNVLVSVHHASVAAAHGFGEIGLPPLKAHCYVATLDSCFAFARRFAALLADRTAAASLAPSLVAPLQAVAAARDAAPLLRALAVLHAMPLLLPSDRAAQCGFEVALLDALARSASVPLWRLLCGEQATDEHAHKPLFYTVGLNDDVAAERATVLFGAQRTRHIKVKVDADWSKAQAMLLRVHETATACTDGLCIVVDANCSWTPATALAFLQWLPTTPLRVTALEQPFAVGHAFSAAELAEWAAVKRAAVAAGLDVVADESCSTAADVQALAPICTAVNIKLEKCGGFSGALELAARAKAASLKTWLGTMVGSTLNSNAVAQLLPLSDLGGDLDGTLLVKPESDLFHGGFEFDASGRARLPPQAAGVGVELKQRRTRAAS